MRDRSAYPTVLVDGHSLTYRAFHALGDRVSGPDGEPYGAVYGFASMLVSLVGRAGRIAACWDLPEPTFRHLLDPGYKQTRSSTPSDLTGQFPTVIALCGALGIPNHRVAGYEADDLIASAARAEVEAGRRVEVVTGDRDTFQLASDRITIRWTRRGVSDIVEMTPAEVEARYGVDPERYIQLAALRGDTSDNLPGVQGVGEKTAAKLLATYGSIDGIYASLSEIGGKTAERLAEGRERVELNLKMIRLHRDVPLDAPVAAAIDRDRWARALIDYGLPSLLDRLDRAAA